MRELMAGVEAFAVILAGGSGTRFWPASTPERPKQFLPLASDRPLLVDTVRRAEVLVGRERVRIVAAAALADPIARLLPGFPSEQLLLEPAPRGTGPALAWAAHALARGDPEAVMISLHADHRIEPLEGLRET
ncbi:MAG: sugar phosphate nucleotidyltransferase, partial [Gemmatimonadota bacterium]